MQDKKHERRARQHAAVRDEIKTMARAHMARDGAAALSLRAVATDLGLSSAAIYYYYPNRDALITDLIVDAYRALGAALRTAGEASVGDDIGARVLTTLLAYRTWAVTHPSEYALLFGTPIPGYVGPVEIIVPEITAALRVLGELFATAAESKRLDLHSAQWPIPGAITHHLAGWQEARGEQVPDDVMLAMLRAWSMCHGLIGLELDSHLQPIIGDAAALYEYECRWLLRSIAVL
jgi:AcrR family transcriptional regulator